jgi:glycosyltransferase involved in cell wall biosynthesis
LSSGLISRWAWQALREPFTKTSLLAAMAAEADSLVVRARSGGPRRLDLALSPLYLRTDLSFGLRAGGSVGHTAGVVNHLHAFAGRPIMLTTDLVPTVDPSIEVATVSPAEAYWEYPELPSLVMNRRFAEVAADVIGPRALSFVYQRYSLNNFSGATLSVERGIPFVLEYNGSEIWMSRNWGTPLEHEALSEKIEHANFAVADLIVVVSQPMADELIARQVPAGKVLVNPNGVEPDRYSPDVDASSLRARLGHPGYRDSLRLLMIGDGVKMPEVMAALDAAGVGDLAVMTGIVPQAEGPVYLAASDILASPHVANSDGTPFFGSPTKLFEYMAMGKGIVASDLDQVGEILEHGRAAQMVRPGDVGSLVEGLRTLIDDPARRADLGAEARRMAVERHSWREHTRKIVEALQARVPPA